MTQENEKGLHGWLMAFKVSNPFDLVTSYARQLSFKYVPWKKILTKSIFDFFNTFAKSIKATQARKITSKPSTDQPLFLGVNINVQYQTIRFWSFYTFSID